MNKILFFFFTAVASACLIQTFSTAAQRREQIPNYSYPPRLLDELKRLQQAALASDYAFKQTAYLANNVGPRLSGSPQAQRAVEYVAGEMRELGLDVRLEKTLIPHWVRGKVNPRELAENAAVMAVLAYAIANLPEALPKRLVSN